MGLLPDTWNCGLRMRRECRERFPRHQLQRKLLVSNPGMHQCTCVTHVPWCMSGSLTCGGRGNVPGIPGACTTRNFTYLARGPWDVLYVFTSFIPVRSSMNCTLSSYMSSIACVYVAARPISEYTRLLYVLRSWRNRCHRAWWLMNALGSPKLNFVVSLWCSKNSGFWMLVIPNCADFKQVRYCHHLCSKMNESYLSNFSCNRLTLTKD